MPVVRETQSPISPMPQMKKSLFSSKVVCKDAGWCLWQSASADSRVDGYHYEENGRHLTLTGEDAELFLPDRLAWDDDLSHPLEPAEEQRILRNITAALQWLGWQVTLIRTV
jgi:hypothetical protein